ncbi:hypothetical protein EMIHUDRAFT_317937 [Emiliania huxleyi CCMP1516]|uniref:Uncharacterized protein n=2 Tax=Emiliania huxleyi TaxID=2903 RepID=A0A0D3IW52_EMIH1|nr:hypothetical protein EMIHUDRAFT_317937 [Emiliania huxleyi CCMP1516]EOD15487.1 hypothetical protein EMIHUDRAFT_317937 [Emiliania huxleyi CCMP1516]|eukprot:XP_005767916.1 hypothetical protein EMIHUDRAFT_317937 [Emiliania huxleyi CCMP1516]
MVPADRLPSRRCSGGAAAGPGDGARRMCRGNPPGRPAAKAPTGDRHRAPPRNAVSAWRPRRSAFPLEREIGPGLTLLFSP